MKPQGIVLMASCLLLWATVAAATDGKALFDRHCSSCHYQGDNPTYPSRPLFRLYREANGLRTQKDLVAKMRRGGQGMPSFAAKQLSDADAMAIAGYIIRTFD
ncbi:cytochrome c6 [Geobacter sp. OR-1]|uniref:c-type cytochrome n=1 Tax=Geobacter sp. OR-1 TaxID=1266765 RepID=UPI000542F757|nr:c-type cytochrome [Geobacter sp. OR-1]GAM10313.1 cytochrome c6 [Geobacter sp. OR-1]